MRAIWFLAALSTAFALNGCNLVADAPPAADRIDDPVVKPADAPAKVTDVSAKAAGPRTVALKFRELEGTFGKWVYHASVSPAGDLIAAGSRDTILVWSIDGGKPITRMTLPHPDSHHIHLAFTPDGKTLVSACDLDTKIRFWEVKTGKQIREMDYPLLPPKGDYMRFKAFSPGATLMAVGAEVKLNQFSRTWGIDLLDLETGKVKVEIREPNLFWRTECDFSPDGKHLIVNGEQDALRLFDTSTGKLVKEYRSAFKQSGLSSHGHVRFSPDGRFISAAEHTGRVETFDKYRAVVWGVADGKRYVEVEDYSSAVLSADNRYLFTGGLASNQKFLFDLLTGEPISIADPKQGLEWWFIGRTPDAKTLIYAGPASSDRNRYQVYLASAPELAQPLEGNGPPTEAALEYLWNGWGSDNAFRTEAAWKLLSAHRELAVGFARKQLTPIPEADAKRVKDLIKLLDDDSPDVRDKATVDITPAGWRFEHLLSDAHAAAGPGEVRNRLTSALRKAKEVPIPLDMKLALRGVELLEKLGTPAAKEVLRDLAKGAAGARLTVEATAALNRLVK